MESVSFFGRHRDAGPLTNNVYGDLLTERQREFYDLYYNEDLSLAEIPALRPKLPPAALKNLEIHKVFPRFFALPPAILTRESEYFGYCYSF